MEPPPPPYVAQPLSLKACREAETRIGLIVDLYTRKAGGDADAPGVVDAAVVAEALRSCGVYAPSIVIENQIVPQLIDDDNNPNPTVDPARLKKRILDMVKERQWEVRAVSLPSLRLLRVRPRLRLRLLHLCLLP